MVSGPTSLAASLPPMHFWMNCRSNPSVSRPLERSETGADDAVPALPKPSPGRPAGCYSGDVSLERISRAPCGPLRPFIRMLWAVDEPASASREPRREHVLPTGHMHLVIRLRQDPLRIFAGPDDSVGTLAGHALIGGSRATFYSRDVSGPQCSVGAQLRPGGAEALFGMPAEEFAYRHTRLDDVWGAAADSMRDRLAELPLGCAPRCSGSHAAGVACDVCARCIPRWRRRFRRSPCGPTSDT